MSLAGLLGDVLPRVASIAVFISLGLFAANLLVAFGLVEKVAGLARYLTGPANLPDGVGTAILATAASPTAGYGMLAEFREEGLSDAATLIAVTINTFFGFVQHIFTFYLPVLIPILGLEVGVMYVGARAAISLAITLTGILAGMVLLSSPEPLSATPSGPDTENATRREKLQEAGERTASKLTTIVPRLAVVYLAVAWLTTNDFANARLLADAATGVTGMSLPDVPARSLLDTVGLPAAAVPVVAVFAVDTTSGAATIAPLLDGTFTARQAVATMLIGGIVSFAFSTFKRSIPFQYGIWGPSFGSKVVALNTLLKVAFIGATLVVLLAP
ncbi:nucleoside recognition protein [Salarchaeum japonicum]|uniref:nucleoside recognition protein n=1 Tax=Salarchaeum japonicum TaxID=555573 RepID=UPI003C72385A